MTWQMLIVFGLLAATFALMVWEKLSLDLVAMLALMTGISFLGLAATGKPRRGSKIGRVGVWGERGAKEKLKR